MNLPRMAIMNFTWDFFDFQKLDTVNDVLAKLPELHQYLQSTSAIPITMELSEFETGIRQGWEIAQQEYYNPQSRIFRELKRRHQF